MITTSNTYCCGDTIVGRCSCCGGLVKVPSVWMGVCPPTPTCESCGAIMAYPVVPTVPTVPTRRPYRYDPRHTSPPSPPEVSPVYPGVDWSWRGTIVSNGTR